MVSDETSARLWRIFCCPCILIYYSCCIYCRGCWCLWWDSLTQCCSAWWCRCCYVMCCDCCPCAPQFEDGEFPAVDNCVGPGFKNVVWARLEDIVRTQHPTPPPGYTGPDDQYHPVLFNPMMSPLDVTEGALGDCWLLSTLAALAEHPALVKKLFISQTYSVYGKYRLQLFDLRRQQWTTIVIDSRVPVHGEPGYTTGILQPRFSMPHGMEIYVPLVEKAVAKLLGSYAELDGGTTRKGLAILLGCEVVEIRRQQGKPGAPPSSYWERYVSATAGASPRAPEVATRDARYTVGTEHTKREYDPLRLFSVMKALCQTNSIMTCTVFDPNGRDLHGLMPHHAYTIVGHNHDSNVHLLLLRNPWGEAGEWRGSWCDSSRLWTEQAAIARDCHFQRGMSSATGLFWIDVYEFALLFDIIDAAVRDTGFDELMYNGFEGRYCGSCLGLCEGCGQFWCCCQGVKALCCASKADMDREEATQYEC